MTGGPNLIRNNWKTIAVYSLVSFLILWPLLGSGFILTLDMVFTPKLALPASITNDYLFYAGLHLLNLVVPSDVIEKLILFAILVLSGLGMHRLMRTLQPISTRTINNWPSYASGLLYMINPFTYSRFMAGQYLVLLGYAFLPFFVVVLLRFINKPSLKSSLLLAAWAVGISMVSIHAIGLIVLVSLVATVQTAIKQRANLQYLKRLARYALIAGLVFIVASSYWLLPLMQGNGSTASSIATFRTSDQSAYATGGNGVAGKLMHVVRLQGFWGERHDLFLLPQDVLPMWGLFVVLIWSLVIVGAIAAWRSSRDIAVLFIVSMLIATLLAAGVGTPWLASHVPLFAGYREPHKFAAIVALGYAVFVGFAMRRLLNVPKTKLRFGGTAVGFLIILIGFTPVMFRGFDGQLVPRHYPADWYVINQRLNKDSGTYQVLFLPWHMYMSFQFAGRVIANPGDGFFDKPLLVSNDPELAGTGPAMANAQKQLLTSHILPQAPTGSLLGHQLAPLKVKYVLLAKDDDYATYHYLDHQTDLKLVSETATLKLYRNTAF